MTPSTDDRAVAVVGMSVRLPGAPTVDDYWALLLAGGSALEPATPAELTAAGVPDDVADDPRYLAVAGRAADTEYFDAAYFGLAPAEAAAMDPQQRVMLEEALHALEDAGWARLPADRRIGVFCGSGENRYGELLRAAGADPGLGSAAAALPLRISYHLDLRGPSVFVQSLCSTALAAVHLARTSLLNGECDAALAGAVSLALPQEHGYLAEDGGVLSATGALRPFDADADGTVPGSGAGVLVLKRLADALASGDTVHAVIRGSALNNDGADRLSFAAPSVAGQREVILAALEDAAIDPATVGLLEAHGTGTPLGDPVELAALLEARRVLGVSSPCAIGAVKSTVGHLDGAAGVAGLVKAVLAVREGVVPATRGHRRLNPAIDLADSGLRVVTATEPWPQADGPRRAAVTALGVGGTNAHLIVEQPPTAPVSAPVPVTATAPAAASAPEGPQPQLLPVSAHTPSAFAQARADLLAAAATVGRTGPAQALAALAVALQDDRRPRELRRALVVGDPDDLSALAELEPVTDRELVLALAPTSPTTSPTTSPAAAAAAAAAAADADAEAEADAVADAAGREFDAQLAGLEALARLGIVPTALHAEGTGEFAALAHSGALPADRARDFAGRQAQALAALDRGAGTEGHRVLAALVAELTGTRPEPPRIGLRSAALDRSLAAGHPLTGTELATLVETAAFGTPGPSPDERLPRVGDPADRVALLRLVAYCWERGATVDWAALRPAGPRPARFALPRYPFRRDRHWHPAATPATPVGRAPVPLAALPERPGGASQLPPGVRGGLAAIWAEVLGIDEPAADDNFYALGGHSIIAAQVLTRIRERFGVRLTLGDFLDADTLADTAALVEAELAADRLYSSLTTGSADDGLDLVEL
ncbi:beta-ketoacyl synthase N-terminal-like domain-containing protein [Kitasatospora sp. NPDC089913]|uniref:beta-ketoacyl synthase N-terminal-like domain-containing protein n=1 Tax=Kitasatospora sp. NPDC089913 TaxID=3364080 RepID=UPI0037F33E2D